MEASYERWHHGLNERDWALNPVEVFWQETPDHTFLDTMVVLGGPSLNTPRGDTSRRVSTCLRWCLSKSRSSDG
jgi:hypothetical protein